MRIAIVGAGAVGGYFGGLLAKAGVEVTFIARGATLKALRTGGLRIDSPKGDVVLPAIRTTEVPSEVGLVDAIILTVKAWQVPEVAEGLRPLIGEQTVVLPLQNGVETAEQLTAALGTRPVLGGTCGIMALQVAPGHIRHVGVEPFIAVGELDNRPSTRVANLVKVLHEAAIAAHCPADIHVSIWKKFLFIAPVSGVGAVTRATSGVMRGTPETRQLIEQAMHEVLAVAAAKGIALDRENVPKTMAFLDGTPPEGTSSMQRDIMEGRPSELEAINGAVVRMGRTLEVATPVNEFIYGALLPLERAARIQRSASGK